MFHFPPHFCFIQSNSTCLLLFALENVYTCDHLVGGIIMFQIFHLAINKMPLTECHIINTEPFLCIKCMRWFLIKICASVFVYAGRRAQIQCSQNSSCCFYSVLPCHVHQWHGGMQTGWDRNAGHGPQVKIQNQSTIKISRHSLYLSVSVC